MITPIVLSADDVKMMLSDQSPISVHYYRDSEGSVYSTTRSGLPGEITLAEFQAHNDKVWSECRAHMDGRIQHYIDEAASKVDCHPWDGDGVSDQDRLRELQVMVEVLTAKMGGGLGG